jgi:two-component system chemotaxis response regulator CheB
VDDSALMRKLLTQVLTETGEIEVVATARDGDQAIQEARRVRPDVVTLDVQMPGRSGLEILPELLAAHEVPVVMVSALTQEGADVTLAALELGAVDYMPKPEKFQFAEMRQSGYQLVNKVLTAAQSRVRRPRRTLRAEPTPREPAIRRPLAPARPDSPAVAGPTGTVVVIGISTGGPQTLAAIVPELEPPIPPILIVQHMPARFTGVFADRLNRHCNLTVKEAEEGDAVLPGRVLIAPGGKHLMVSGSPPRVFATLSDAPPTSGHKPSVDVLFGSAARVYGSGAVGFIMTGMGRDGVEGCKAILAAGGDTYGQDEASSVVFGMNKAAIQEGAVRAQFGPEDLPAILRLLGRRSS